VIILIVGVLMVLAVALWFGTEYVLKRTEKKPKKRKRRRR
jgi:hypothetical protein